MKPDLTADGITRMTLPEDGWNILEVNDELVAYLDGEVTDTQRSAIEQRLSVDPEYRHRLVELQAAWQWLDQLPAIQPDDSFTQSTMALAMTDVCGGPDGDVARRGLLGRMTKAGLAAALAGMLGFAAVYVPSFWRHQANLRELPMMHNLDLYRYADNFEFLQLLHDERIFEEHIDDMP